MKPGTIIATLAVGLLFVSPQMSHAQEGEMTRILFMLDASQSMSNRWVNKSKIEAAKVILGEIIDSLKEEENVQMALRVYGHQTSQALSNCKDTKLEVGFSDNNHILIKSKLKGIQPKGITPISYALEKSGRDFPRDPNSRNIIILITDGEESCKGDPCAVSKVLQKNKVILKPFVIGLAPSTDLKKRLDCVGAYYDAGNPDELEGILKSIVRNVIDKTTTQVKLLDIDDQPTETDVNMTFYNPISKVAQYQYYHTINSRGYPDTIEVDPINTYDLIIHTIPSVELNEILITPNTHNVIELPTPQGFLKLIMESKSGFESKIQSLIKYEDAGKTINAQQMNSTEKYLVGTYNLEILTLPRIKLDNIEIGQSKTTTIQIPSSGLITIYSSVEIYGGIFISTNNQLQKIYTLNDRILKETLYLQPGSYSIIYRSKLSKDMNSTVERQFQVKSGESITIKL